MRIAKFGLWVAVVGAVFIGQLAKADVPSIASLSAQGFEVKAAYHSEPFDVVLLQKGKDVFLCTLKIGYFTNNESGCFPIK